MSHLQPVEPEVRPPAVLPADSATPSTPAVPPRSLKDGFETYVVGLGTLGFGLAMLGTLLVGVVLVYVILGLLIVTGVMKWLVLLAVLAVPVAVWLHRNYEPPPPPAPRMRRRLAGIYGDACYAPLEDVYAHGLVPPDRAAFADAVYLGEFLDWYGPETEGFRRPGQHLGYTGENNIVTIAPAGTGKGTTAIVQTAALNGESTFILDVKGENYAVTARARATLHGHRIVRINPFNMFAETLGSAAPLTDGFNPLAELDPADESFTTQIDALAAAMIVQEGNDPHWSNRARDLVACLMAHVCSDPEERAAGHNNLPYVRRILGAPREEFAAYLTLAQANPLPRVRHLAGGFSDPTSKEVGSIISTALGQLAFLDHPQVAAFLEGSAFSFTDLRREPMTIYLMLPPNELNTYYRFARLIVQACFNALSVEPREGDRRVLLLLDEQAQLKYMESVANAIALLRGYRDRIWSIYQDLNQLESIYGDRWESFLSNAGVVQVFTPNDQKTAEYFSRKIGNFTAEAVSHNFSVTTGSSSGNGPGGHGSSNSGTSHGTSTSAAGTPFLSPQDFYGLPDWQSVLFVRGGRDPIPALKLPYWRQPHLEGLLDPNPYHDMEGFRAVFRMRAALEEAETEGRPFSLLAPVVQA